MVIALTMGYFMTKNGFFNEKQSKFSIAKAEALLNNNQKTAAFSHISKLILEDSTKHEAYIFRAQIHENEGRFENAIQDIQKAEKFGADKAYVFERYGVLYAKQNQLEKSLSFLNKAIDQEQSNTYLYNSRGITFSLMENFELALLDFNKAIEVEPQNNQARLNRANLFFKTSDYDKAKKDLEYLKGIEPQNFPINFKLGLIELKKGNIEIGLEMIRPFATTSHRAAQIAENLVSERFFEESLEFYKIAIGNESLREKMFFQRADVYHELNQYQNAIDDLLIIVETMPGAAIFYKIGILYMKLEDIGKACEFWHEAKIREHVKVQELINQYCPKS